MALKPNTCPYFRSTACTARWTPGQKGNPVKFGIDIGYLSPDVPFWDKVAATCTSEADPSRMTVYVGVPLDKLESGMDSRAPENQDEQKQNSGDVNHNHDSGSSSVTHNSGSDLGGGDEVIRLCRLVEWCRR